MVRLVRQHFEAKDAAQECSTAESPQQDVDTPQPAARREPVGQPPAAVARPAHQGHPAAPQRLFGVDLNRPPAPALLGSGGSSAFTRSATRCPSAQPVFATLKPLFAWPASVVAQGVLNNKGRLGSSGMGQTWLQPIAETNSMQLVLFGTQNRALRPSVAAIHWTFISAMHRTSFGGSSPGEQRVSCIAELNAIRLLLFKMNNRIFGPFWQP
jgi:hypothetical protein